jgi:NAD(P)-dependent dehydrogenase (short-subunit alcohol dehydrogenase family)
MVVRAFALSASPFACNHPLYLVEQLLGNQRFVVALVQGTRKGLGMRSTPLAIVTGALEPGIGKAVTARLLRDGYEVIGSYEPSLTPDRSGFSSPERLTLIETDHASRSALQYLVDAVPGERAVAALVNGQSYFEMENPDNFDFTVWDRSLAVNLTAPKYLFHALRSKLAAGASVVTITSTEGFIGSFGASAYAATKAAIHNLTKTLANNAGCAGVRVNAVATGWIGGVMETDEVFNMSRSITPLGRLGSPEEVAAVVAFLLSSESSFVNGSVVVADGGYTGVDTISKHEFESSKSE